MTCDVRRVTCDVRRVTRDERRGTIYLGGVTWNVVQGSKDVGKVNRTNGGNWRGGVGGWTSV